MFQFTRYSLATCVAAIAFTGSAALAQLQPRITLEKVDAIDDNNQAAWWSPVVHDPVENATYVVYNRPYELADDYDPNNTQKQDYVYIAKRDANGNWTKVDTGGRAWFDPGHRQPSLAMDGDGYLHVFYAMHTDKLRYRVSNAPREVTDGFTYAPWDVDDNWQSAFTYPNLTTTPDGDVYMLIRDYPDGKLYHYDSATKDWALKGTFAQEDGTTVYPDHIYADADGDVHMIWEWAAGGAQPARHLGTYARFDPDTGLYYRADGTAYEDSPITTKTADVFQPLEGGEKFERDSHGFQSAKMTLDDQGRPVIVYAYSTNNRSNGYEFRVARWDGEEWVRNTVVDGPFSNDKPWITFSDGMLRIYSTLSPEDPLHTGSDDIFLRTSMDLGETWSDPIAITTGLDIQRPIGTTVNGVDYLYLPSIRDGELYLAQITVPEPTASAALLGAGATTLLKRPRR